MGGGRRPARWLVGWMLLFLGLGSAFAGCSSRVLGYEVVKSFPHDSDAYTQGLLWHEGKLFESTGRNGSSSLRRVELETGKVEKQVDLPWQLFAEGLVRHGGLFYQLTWTSEQCRVYDGESLELKKTLEYEGEGWGLASDGKQLIMSNGTDLLSYRDPDSFEELRRVRVRDGDKKLLQINELEYITSGRFQGELWANVWKSFAICRIDPRKGKVLGWIDLTGIYDPSGIEDPDAVLNGIAFDAAEERIFVTGKLWPRLFWIRVK